VPSSRALLGGLAIGARVAMTTHTHAHTHVCKLIGSYAANAYSAEREMSASACTRSTADLLLVDIEAVKRIALAAVSLFIQSAGRECRVDRVRCEDESPAHWCISRHWLCDGADDCGNNWDEDATMCGKTRHRGASPPLKTAVHNRQSYVGRWVRE